MTTMYCFTQTTEKKGIACCKPGYTMTTNCSAKRKIRKVPYSPMSTIYKVLELFPQSQSSYGTTMVIKKSCMVKRSLHIC